MEINYHILKPNPFGKIVKNYLKVLKENTEYPAWTINDKLEVVKCIGMIANDGSWNYHNNYDDSEDVLYVIENKTNAPYYNKTYHTRTDIYYTTEFNIDLTTNCITFKSYDYTEKTLCGNYEIEKQY